MHKAANRKYSASAPLKVLRLGNPVYAQSAWAKLTADYPITVTSTNSTNRSEFIEELKAGKYLDVGYITRTFESCKQTGLFDIELLDLIKEYTKVEAISHNGAGYDQVDATKCAELNIQVSNVPTAVDNATADTAVYLVLGAVRNFQYSTERMKAGAWPSTKCAGADVGHDPDGKVLGILGMGGIGRTIRDRLEPFGFKGIAYHNRKQLSDDLAKGAEYCATPDELYKRADVICVSVPLNKATKHMINEKAFESMKDGVIIVNTARGPIVDESALKKALQSGKVGAFAADVWENEPNVDMELIAMRNVTCLPHMGTFTVETMKKMEEFVVKNVETFVETGDVLSLVSECSSLRK